MSKIDFLEIELSDLKTQLGWYIQENDRLKKQLQQKDEELKTLQVRSAKIIKNVYLLRTEVRDAFIKNDVLW
jgi:regulator of replication initiation timing